MNAVSAQPMDVLVDGEKVVALLAPGDASLGADPASTAAASRARGHAPGRTPAPARRGRARVVTRRRRT